MDFISVMKGYYKGLNKISKGFDSGLLTRMILFDP